MSAALSEILICPRCHSGGLDLSKRLCFSCFAEFFDLQGVPCVFPAGKTQRNFWEDLFAKFLEQTELTREQHRAEISRPELLAETRERLEEMLALRMGTAERIAGLLREAGLRPQKHVQFAAFTPESFVQYYELMLRDWAWHPLTNQNGQYRIYEDENRQSFDVVQDLLQNAGITQTHRMLVIGSGAGRLSWDLHCSLKPEITVALDQHPLLIFLSHFLIKMQRTFSLLDTRKFPQYSLPKVHEWVLQCPDADETLRESWVAIAGDAWAAPFKPGSFDLVVTPWFLDITGRDAKNLLAVVERMLSPSGCWLNHGPLLYSDGLPESQKYTFHELRELLRVGHFQIQSEDFSVGPYTYSPLSQRGRIEEVWSFVARSADDRAHLKNAGECPTTVSRTDPPAWLILPHLPIPKLTKPGLIPAELQAIARLIDGTHSINDLAEILAPNLPQGHDPKEFVYGFFDEYVLDK